MNISCQRIQTNQIELDVHQAGPEDGELVILLHGFPEFGLAWKEQILFLASKGYRVWAPDQRGYANSSKPQGISQYSLEVLSQDIVGLIKASGEEKARIIGHDWGGAVTWWLACNFSEHLSQAVILNVPHHDAFLEYVKKSPSQLFKSWYMFFFLIPWIPETMLKAFNCFALRRQLITTSNKGTFTQSDLQQYIDKWSTKGALKSMLNWYRSSLLSPPKSKQSKTSVPTSIIWGKKDKFLSHQLAEISKQYCDLPNEVHYIENAGHWLVHEETDMINKLLLKIISSNTN